MNAQDLSKLYSLSLRALKMNLSEVTHTESLVAPPSGGNSLNWVVGHIVASRNDILELLGEAPIWGADQAQPYVRGAQGFDAAAARPFESIVSDLERSQERLLKALAAVSEERLDQVQGTKPVREQLSFLQFHEVYHIGQVGLLRRIAGKEGAIK